MIDAVLSYHMNPQTCGVAKFNHALAKRLGVPMYEPRNYDKPRHPLVSLKSSEWDLWWSDIAKTYNQYSLFLHDSPPMLGCNPINTLQRAVSVYAGNQAIADDMRPHRPDVIKVFCPSTIDGNPHRGAYRVLVFGMAHKLNLPHFEKLKEHLDEAHPDYTIELSTAVHEGNPWDESIQASVGAMRGVFGARLRVLGYLGDDALARVLHEVDAVAAYFVPALRANNTSYWAAVDAGKTIYTNRDELSPKETDPPASWDRLVELFR